MKYKFTLLTPKLFTEPGENNISDDFVEDFARHLQNCSSRDYGMICHLPTEPGDAFLTSFNVFEEKFLKNSEYALLIISQNSADAIRKFYPRLLVFLSMRPEWCTRFVLLQLGEVHTHKSVDLSILTNAPIQFAQDWHDNPENNNDSWKKLFSLLQVKWTPHIEKCSDLHNHPSVTEKSHPTRHNHHHSGSSEIMSDMKVSDDYATNAADKADEESVREQLKLAGYDNNYIEAKHKVISESDHPKKLLHVQNQGCSLDPRGNNIDSLRPPNTLSVESRDLTDSGAGWLSDSSDRSDGTGRKHSHSKRHRHVHHGHHEHHMEGGRAVQQESTTTVTTTKYVTEETVILPKSEIHSENVSSPSSSRGRIHIVRESAALDNSAASNSGTTQQNQVNSKVISFVHQDDNGTEKATHQTNNSLKTDGSIEGSSRHAIKESSISPQKAKIEYSTDNSNKDSSNYLKNEASRGETLTNTSFRLGSPAVTKSDAGNDAGNKHSMSQEQQGHGANDGTSLKSGEDQIGRQNGLEEPTQSSEGFSISKWFSNIRGKNQQEREDEVDGDKTMTRSGLEDLDDSSGRAYTTNWMSNFIWKSLYSLTPEKLDKETPPETEAVLIDEADSTTWRRRWLMPSYWMRDTDSDGEGTNSQTKGVFASIRELFSWSQLMGSHDEVGRIDDRYMEDLPDWWLLYIIVNTSTAYTLRYLYYPRLVLGNGSREIPGEDYLKQQMVSFQSTISRVFRKPLCVTLLFATATIASPYYNQYSRYIFAAIALFIKERVDFLPGYPLFPFQPERIRPYPASGTWFTKEHLITEERFGKSIILPQVFRYIDEIVECSN